MFKTILVKLINVYGEVKIYPQCIEAEAFAAIAGTKTLTDSAIENIKLLGYTVKVYQPKLPATL